jgi:hypothetical protein
MGGGVGGMLGAYLLLLYTRGILRSNTADVDEMYSRNEAQATNVQRLEEHYGYKVNTAGGRIYNATKCLPCNGTKENQIKTCTSTLGAKGQHG